MSIADTTIKACSSSCSHAILKMTLQNNTLLVRDKISLCPVSFSSQVIDASVVAISDVLAEHPALEVTIDPTDLTRVRFVMILQNYKGEVKRLRLVQWNDLNADKYRKMMKEDSAKLGGDTSTSGWAQALMYSVDSTRPSAVEKMLGLKKRS